MRNLLLIFLFVGINFIYSCEKYEDKGIGTKLPELTKEDLLKTAQFFVKIKSYSRAEKVYSQIITNFPDIQEPYYALCEIYETTGEYDKLIRLYDKIISKFPGFSEIFLRKKESLLIGLWRWKDLVNLYENIISKKDESEKELEKLKMKRDSLKRNCELKSLFDDNFTNGLSEFWILKDSYSASIFEGTLKIKAEKEPGILGSLDFICKNYPFKISVDFRIDSIYYASSVGIGLLKKSNEANKNCAMLKFSCWGAVEREQGGGLLHFSYSVDSDFERTPSLFKSSAQEFEKGIWHTLQFEYVPALSLLTVFCYQRD